MSDMYIQIQNAMTVEEQATFLKNFGEANPHWRGAHVADVLAELDNVDANLDLIESMFEMAPEVSQEITGRRAVCVNAIYWAHGREAVTWNRVEALRIRAT